MNANTYIIRAAGFNDAEAIYKLIRQYPRELLPRPINDIVQNMDRFLVCTINNKVVGTVSWQILPEVGSSVDPTIEIKSLAVSRKLRRKGIGKQLVMVAIEKIKELKPLKIIALTFTPTFFKHIGFKKISKRKLMHKIYAGCINCAKYDSPFTCPEVAMVLTLREPSLKAKNTRIT